MNEHISIGLLEGFCFSVLFCIDSHSTTFFCCKNKMKSISLLEFTWVGGKHGQESSQRRMQLETCHAGVRCSACMPSVTAESGLTMKHCIIMIGINSSCTAICHVFTSLKNSSFCPHLITQRLNQSPGGIC